MSHSRTSRSRSATPLLVRLPLLLPLALALLFATAGDSCANIWYEAWLNPLGEEPSVPPAALLSCAFPRQPNRHLPSCMTTEPMSLHFDEPELEGELTAIVFRLGDEHGETIFRVPADVQTIPFDQEDCDLLLTWSNEDSFVFTPFFVVIETTAHPEGELGARLHVIAEQPTLERGWGEVKSLYVEAP